MLDYASFPEQRQSLIRDLLRREGRVICVKLAQELRVSEHTIRRDLRELEQEGGCKRVYGGAVSLSRASGSFADRLEDNSLAKRRLGQACARLIRKDSCLFIDSGTTNLAVAKAIPHDLPLTVVTNAPLIAAEMMKAPRCEVILLGGYVHASIGGALGITPLRQVESMSFDQCILGGCALDAVEGVTIFDYQDAEFKQAVVRRSSEIIVALTADKIPSVARYAVLPCDALSALVVEHAMARDQLAPFMDKDIDIHFADA